MDSVTSIHKQRVTKLVVNNLMARFGRQIVFVGGLVDFLFTKDGTLKNEIDFLIPSAQKNEFFFRLFLEPFEVKDLSGKTHFVTLRKTSFKMRNAKLNRHGFARFQDHQVEHDNYSVYVFGVALDIFFWVSEPSTNRRLSFNAAQIDNPEYRINLLETYLRSDCFPESYQQKFLTKLSWYRHPQDPLNKWNTIEEYRLPAGFDPDHYCKLNKKKLGPQRGNHSVLIDHFISHGVEQGFVWKEPRAFIAQLKSKWRFKRALMNRTDFGSGIPK